jgi:hypothetical protein
MSQDFYIKDQNKSFYITAVFNIDIKKKIEV